MSILLKNATIVDGKSNLNFKTKDILINDGDIVDIADTINTKASQTIKLENLHVSRGWMDTSVCFGEPGFEERETILNGLETAASSGFTSILLNPNCDPAIDNHSSIEFLKRKSAETTTEIYPIGSLTNNSKGEELASLFDMKVAGAVAFGDYKQTVKDTSLLKISLEYSKTFGARIISFSQDDFLSENGVINEGIISTQLGLKGIPSISESISIFRDIEILEYSDGKIHFPFVNTKRGVELIRNAKKRNLDITCSASLAHISLSDEDIIDFNTDFKLIPPLRGSSDVQALKQGVIDGTIDYVTSMHEPINDDYKKVVFDHALPGSISLECAFGILCNNFTLEKSIDILTRRKDIFNIEDFPIEIGSKANLTIFNPESNYVFSKKHILSSSKNCAFIGLNMKGVVYGSINNSKATLNRLWT